MVNDSITGNSTTGPLLDWWYVHAGYMGFKDGISKSWDVPMGVEIEAQPAEKSEPILQPDRPWEKEKCGPVTSFFVKEGRYIIDYYSPGGLCRAESEDGYNWTKPDLGLYDISRDMPHLKTTGKHNNVILGSFSGGIPGPSRSGVGPVPPSSV